MLRHLKELRLRELVPQSLDELRVDLDSEGSHLRDCFRQIGFTVPTKFLHVLVPHVGLLQLPRREDDGRCRDLRRLELQQSHIQHGDLLNVLSVEEDLLIVEHGR